MDGRTGAIRGTIPDAAGSAAAGAGSVWIPNNQGTVLNRVDPKTLKIQKVIRLHSGNVAFDGHFIWSAPAPVGEDRMAKGNLAKIDPATNSVVANYRVPPMRELSMTYGFGALWFKPPDASALYRFDVSSGRTTSTALEEWQSLTSFFDQPIAIGSGSLWLRASDGIVVRIDPSNSQVVGSYTADPSGGGGFPL